LARAVHARYRVKKTIYHEFISEKPLQVIWKTRFEIFFHIFANSRCEHIAFLFLSSVVKFKIAHTLLSALKLTFMTAINYQKNKNVAILLQILHFLQCGKRCERYFESYWSKIVTFSRRINRLWAKTGDCSSRCAEVFVRRLGEYSLESSNVRVWSSFIICFFTILSKWKSSHVECCLFKRRALLKFLTRGKFTHALNVAIRLILLSLSKAQ